MAESHLCAILFLASLVYSNFFYFLFGIYFWCTFFFLIHEFLRDFDRLKIWVLTSRRLASLYNYGYSSTEHDFIGPIFIYLYFFSLSVQYLLGFQSFHTQYTILQKKSII